MGRRILLIQGHPDNHDMHLCHALMQAYAEGAIVGRHEIRKIDVGRLDFPLLRSQAQWERGPLPPVLAPAQEAILWAEHLVLLFPLWLGDMPALLKGFLEQVARPDFAFDPASPNPLLSKALAGRSARVVVTMGMPAAIYHWYFRAHSIKSLERNILGVMGIGPVQRTLVGSAKNMSVAEAGRWMGRMRKLGRAAG